MKKYSFPEKSAEELAKEMDQSAQDSKEFTLEEKVEDDAEGGYFQNQNE